MIPGLSFDKNIDRITADYSEQRRSMRSRSVLALSFFLVSVLQASVDFTRFSDMCEPTTTQHCPNKPEEVKALQKALNANEKLYLFIKADGRWRPGTKEAVIVFQKKYGIKPASGYVGKVTRRMLQKISGGPLPAPASKAKSNAAPAQKQSHAPTPPSLPKAAPTREFVLYGDMCDNTVAGNHCPNKVVQVTNLQVLLNADPNLNVHIATDGKWGKGTQEAVIAFQKRYGIRPASGYVGPRTKRMLDRVAGAIVARATLPASSPAPHTKPAAKQPKRSAILSWQDMCTPTVTDYCPNRPEDVRALQAFLNTVRKHKLRIDGKWGKGTHDAVVEFQKQHKIVPASGYVGAKTRRVMQKVARKPHARIRSARPLHPIRTYADFRKYTDYPRTYKVFKDEKLLARANGRNTQLKVDISQQRMRLYVNNRVALDSPCTTGSSHKLEPNTRTIRDKSTPKGIFRIREKIALKRSTIFGDIYRNGKKVYHGDRRKYKGSWKGAKFVGHPLKNWMRLTDSGIGFHASRYIKRYPGSNGCIRLPYAVANVVFKKVKPGTKVRIVN